MASVGQKLPRRTCISCRETSEKRELVRIVRTANGQAEVDLTGKKPGRGAYLCLRQECWAEATKKGRLDAALRTSLKAESRAGLEEFVSKLETAAVL